MDHLGIDEQNLIDRYVRGTMPAPERAEFEEHFIGCAACQEQIEIAKSLRQAVRESVAETVQPARQRHRPGFRWRWAAMASFAGLLIALAALLSQRQSARSQVASLERAPVVFGLSLTRDAAEPQTIAIPGEPRWMVFLAEIDATRYSRYRVSLIGSREEDIWSEDGIRPNSTDSISVSIPSSKLSPGMYAMVVSATQADGSSTTVARFPLRLVAGK